MKRSFLLFQLILASISFSLAFTPIENEKSTKKITPIFKDGEAQIVEEFKDPEKWITQDLWVETEFDTDGDGLLDRMHVDVIRPEQTETQGLKLPVIYNTSPYFAGVAPGLDYYWDVRHELNETPPKRNPAPAVVRKGQRPVISKAHTTKWIPRGYIVVHSSSPGTGLSDGSPTIHGTNEYLAPKAVIEWLCGNAKGYSSRRGTEEVKAYWCTGKVGMTGTSYNGSLPIAAATTGVDGLKAIIPVSPNTSPYHYYRSNGLVRSPSGYLGEDVDVLYDFIHSGDVSKRAYADSVYRDGEIAKGIDRETGDYNKFWKERDFGQHLGKFKAALLMSHGFNDWNVMPEHSYRIYKAIEAKGDVPCQIYYHQNGHGGEPPMKMMNRWFTRYLHGIENGVENDPKAWIVREYDDPQNPTPYKDYPNPAAKDVQFYLSAGAPGFGKLSPIEPKKQGKETLVDNFSFAGEALAQAEYTNHRLMFVSSVLMDSIHISGLSSITIKLASSKPAANLSVWLVSLPWTNKRKGKITDNIITRGWADPQNYKSLTRSKPLKQGKFYEMTFDLQPDDQIIPKGQQIGLMIFSSDKNFTLHPNPGTELTIDLDATVLTLPIVGGKEAFK